jgi:hypothetical protein
MVRACRRPLRGGRPVLCCMSPVRRRDVPGEASCERGRQRQSHQNHQHRMPGQLVLIMPIGPLADGSRTHWIRGFTALERAGSALDPGFHCVRTQWIRGFMAFQLARCTRTVMLMVPTCPECSFLSEDRRYVMSRGADSSERGECPANTVKLYDKGDDDEEMCLKLRTQPEPATGLRQACANRHQTRVMIVR